MEKSRKMNMESHMISKLKPRIRIVHIFAPEIIKTDVANFRELVQRLTGKPVGRKPRTKSKINRKQLAKTTKRISDEAPVKEEARGKPAETADPEDCYRFSGFEERVKEEEAEIWGGGENSSFFGGFGDLEGFIQGLSEFPLAPLTSSHMDLFGETSLSQ